MINHTTCRDRVVLDEHQSSAGIPQNALALWKKWVRTESRSDDELGHLFDFSRDDRRGVPDAGAGGIIDRRARHLERISQILLGHCRHRIGQRDLFRAVGDRHCSVDRR